MPFPVQPKKNNQQQKIKNLANETWTRLNYTQIKWNIERLYIGIYSREFSCYKKFITQKKSKKIGNLNW